MGMECQIAQSVGQMKTRIDEEESEIWDALIFTRLTFCSASVNCVAFFTLMNRLTFIDSNNHNFVSTVI